jgi:hypothetical protein
MMRVKVASNPKSARKVRFEMLLSRYHNTISGASSLVRTRGNTKTILIVLVAKLPQDMSVGEVHIRSKYLFNNVTEGYFRGCYSWILNKIDASCNEESRS